MVRNHPGMAYTALCLWSVAWVVTPTVVRAEPTPAPATVPTDNLRTEADAAEERFIVFGDMGTGRQDQKDVARLMAARARRDRLNFVITVGDNFYEDGVTSVDDPQWVDKFETVYADAALQVPFYASLGNHDHRGNVQAQIDYSRKSNRWIMPGRYYTITRSLADGTRVALFALDTHPIRDPKNKEPEAVNAQLNWLDKQLEACTARWKIVFGHHPVYSHGYHGHEPQMIARVAPLLEKHRADVYFAGHDHTLELLKPVGGVLYVISGGGAGPDKAYEVKQTEAAHYAATGGGFAWCRISRDKLAVEFVRMEGQTDYVHVVRK